MPECKLKPLELKRIIIDIVLAFKIMHRIVDFRFDQFFSLSTKSQTMGHDSKPYPRLCHSNKTNHFSPIELLDFETCYVGEL